MPRRGPPSENVDRLASARSGKRLQPPPTASGRSHLSKLDRLCVLPGRHLLQLDPGVTAPERSDEVPDSEERIDSGSATELDDLARRDREVRGGTARPVDLQLEGVWPLGHGELTGRSVADLTHRCSVDQHLVGAGPVLPLRQLTMDPHGGTGRHDPILAGEFGAGRTERKHTSRLPRLDTAVSESRCAAQFVTLARDLRRPGESRAYPPDIGRNPFVAYGRRLVASGILCAILFGVVSTASAAPGELDPTFGSGGKVTTPLEATAMSTAVVVQPDGKVVAAGTADNNGSFALVRYNRDGTLDRSFGTGGVAKKPVGHTGVFGMVLQPDGRFVVVGHAGTAFGLVRFNGDGSVDDTFGSGGLADGAPIDSPASPTAIALQPDGKLVVVGSAGHPSRVAVVRYLPDGRLDEAFGTSGIVKSLLGNSSGATGLALQPDGKIVVVGTTEVSLPSGLGFQQKLAAARYNPDGTLDDTFGTDGMVITAIGNAPQSEGRVVQVQPDGKLVVAATIFPELAVIRLDGDGAFDHTFGVNGVAVARIGSSSASGLVIQPDGKIAVNGIGHVDGQFRLVLARFTANGALDDTFGTRGVVTTPPDTTGETAKYGVRGFRGEAIRGLVLQPDGKFISAGYQYIDGTGILTLFRYQAVTDAGSAPTTATTGSPAATTPGQPTTATNAPSSAPTTDGPVYPTTSLQPAVGSTTLPATGAQRASSLTVLGMALIVAGFAIRSRAHASAGATHQDE